MEKHLPFFYLSLSGVIANAVYIIATSISNKPEAYLFTKAKLINFGATTFLIIGITFIFFKILSSGLFSKKTFVYFLANIFLTFFQFILGSAALFTVLTSLKPTSDFTQDVVMVILLKFLGMAPIILCLLISNLVISSNFRKSRNH